MPKATNCSKLALLSNFNLQNLGAMLKKDAEVPRIDPVLAPFGQVTQALLDPAAEIWTESVSNALIWTTPECVSGAFARLLNHERVDQGEILADVDAFADALRRIPRSVTHVFIPSWTALTDRWRIG